MDVWLLGLSLPLLGVACLWEAPSSSLTQSLAGILSYSRVHIRLKIFSIFVWVIKVGLLPMIFLVFLALGFDCLALLVDF